MAGNNSGKSIADIINVGAARSNPGAVIPPYERSHNRDNTRKLFDEMLDRDVVSWNSIVNGDVKAGEVVIARQLFDAMPKRNLDVWNVIMNGYLNLNNLGKCLKLFREMTQGGLDGNDAIVVLVHTACAWSARLREGKSVQRCLLKVKSKLKGHCKRWPRLLSCAELVSSGVVSEKRGRIRLVQQSNGSKRDYNIDIHPSHLRQAPYQRKLIDVSLLVPEEIEWLNEYHANCREILAPYMNTSEMDWLKKATETIAAGDALS